MIIVQRSTLQETRARGSTCPMPILPYPRATYPTSVRFFEPVMYYSAVVGRLVTELGLLQTRHVLQTDGARGKGREGGPSHFRSAHGPFAGGKGGKEGYGQGSRSL